MGYGMHNLSTDWHMAVLLGRAESKSALGIVARSPHLLHPSVQQPTISNVATLFLSLAQFGSNEAFMAEDNRTSGVCVGVHIHKQGARMVRE